MPPKTKDLGSVIDGRIRKAWPVTAPGGPIRAVHSGTKGLRNPGVLCYRNSVLQCLLHIPEFFNYLCNRDRCSTPGDGCVFCSLRSLALAYWSNTDQSFPKAAPDSLNIAMNQYPGLHESDDKASYGFLKRSKKSKNDMNRSGQQDAHEYFLGIYGMLKHTNNDFLHRIRYVCTPQRLLMRYCRPSSFHQAVLFPQRADFALQEYRWQYRPSRQKYSHAQIVPDEAEEEMDV